MNEQVGKTLWVAEVVPAAREKIDYFLEEAGHLRSQIDNRQLPDGTDRKAQLERAKRFALEAGKFLSEAINRLQHREDLDVLQRRKVRFEEFATPSNERNGPIGFYNFVAETLNRHVPFLRALRDHLNEESGTQPKVRAGAALSASGASWNGPTIGVAGATLPVAKGYGL